jgi:hypothetical protein
MATGIIKVDPRGITVRLLENLAAAQGAPADGAPADMLKERPSSVQFFDLAALYAAYLAQYSVPFEWPDVCTIRLYETAGSGTMTVAYARLWLYDTLSQKAFPAGIGADATKGYLNGGSAYGETGANLLRGAEPLMYPGHCDGINVELGTFGDASQRHNVDWFIPSPGVAALMRITHAKLDELRAYLDDLTALAKEHAPQTI